MADSRDIRGGDAEPISTRAEETHAPLGGTRAEALQRLQIGLAGLAAMVLLVGLAGVILERANQNEANTVPEAAATLSPVPEAQNEALSGAGVVPDLAENPNPTPAPTEEAPILPIQGEILDDREP